MAKKNNILIGAYRSEKEQLQWILGINPERNDILYNVRYNEDIFANRDGGITSKKHPDFILLYDYKDISKGAHLFECISSSIMSEDDMHKLSYPQPFGTYVLYRLGKEIVTPFVDIEKFLVQYTMQHPQHINGAPIFEKQFDITAFEDKSRLAVRLTAEKKQRPIVRFIDLFAGIGGIRCGLEQACREKNYTPVCVFTSEIKPYAVNVLHDNHPTEQIAGDITQIKTADIPDFDILCAGFPCQAFSSAGKRKGFADTRGTMFFQVERILKDKKPKGFILENVEGLVNHDGGRTLATIVEKLTNLGYYFDYRVLNSKFFGVPQERKRIYIVGTRTETPNLNNFPHQETKLKDILETGMPTENTPFVQNLLAHFTVEQLYGKSIKDKRGGDTNIHSWDLCLKGNVSLQEKALLDNILLQRRKKQWAEEIGIDWMDGMPLTLQQIKTFYDDPNLQSMLDKLTKQGYLRYEHPKKLVKETNTDGLTTTHREYDLTKEKGYNIVAGKLSFEINKVLSPEDVAPTLVAMDMQKLYVGDNGGLRRFTLREGLRLCGYPDNMIFNVSEKDGFDLLGNTVVVPVIKAVANRLLDKITFK